MVGGEGGIWQDALPRRILINLGVKIMITKKRITITIDVDLLTSYRTAFPAQKISTEINRFMRKRVKRSLKKDFTRRTDKRQISLPFKKVVIL